MNRKFSFGLTFLICVIFAVPCFGGGQSGNTSGTVTGPGSAAGKLVSSDVTIDVMLPESPLVPLNNNFTFYQYLYDRTGIKINFIGVPSSDYSVRRSLALSTADFPDVIQIAQAQVNDFASEGIFVNLSKHKNDLPNYFNIVEKYPEAKVTFIDGESFAFPTIARWDKPRGSTLIMRQDILDALKINEASIKTFDDFYNVLKAVKNAYPNIIPFIQRGGSNSLMSLLGYSLGSDSGISFDPQQRKWVYAPVQPQTRVVLAYLHKLYSESLLDPDYATTSGTDWQQKMASNKSFSYLDNVGMANTNLPALRGIVPNASWNVIRMPQNSFGYARGLLINPHQLGRLWAVNSSSKKIDNILKLFNFLYTEEACDILNLGKEGIDFVYGPDGRPQLTPARIAKSTVDGIYVQRVGQAETGAAAYETFIPYSDNLSYFIQLPEHQEAWYKTIENDPAFVYPVNAPPFNERERGRLSEIVTNLSTIATVMFDKLIMGIDNLDTFNSYVARMKAAYSDEVEKIYNDAQARLK